MRALWVAGIGGLVVGHILWLAGISAAIASTDVQKWVLVVSTAAYAVGLVAALIGVRQWKRKNRTAEVWAVFLWALAVAPVLMSTIVLGVTYL